MYGHPVLRLWRAVKWLHAYTIMENDIEVHVLTKHADIPAMKRNARDNKLKIIIYNSELKNKMIVL